MRLDNTRNLWHKIKLFTKYKIRFTTAQTLVVGFAVIIFIGTVLLMLPVSCRASHSTGFIDAFFTATSATCITGLVVFDTYTYWSTFGQIVILSLIQIGGLGFMTMGSVIAFILRSKISFRQRLAMSESIGLDVTSGVVRMTRHILTGTVIFEAAGALILSVKFIPEFGFVGGIYKGIFHAVSAFCNSGMDLMGEKQIFSSLSSYTGDWIVNFTIMLLITVGGTGFFVWEDIYHSKNYKSLSLHSKLVISINAALVIFGAVMIFFMDFHNPATLGKLPFSSKVLASLFQSVTSRTAGFNTIDLASLSVGSTFVMMILMFIGGAPGSTAGGVKTTTIGLLFFTALASVRGNSDVNAFRHRIDHMAVFRAVTAVLLSICVVAAGTIILSASNPFYSFKEIVFEVISAFGTVGLSLGITPTLTPLSKITLALIMFFGRVGVVTIMLSLTLKGLKTNSKIRYPIGRIMI